MTLLRKYFLLAAIPALIAVGLASVLDYNITQNLLKEQIQQTLDAKLDSKCNEVRHFLDEKFALLKALVEMPQVREPSFPEILEFLKIQEAPLVDRVTGLYFVELDGTAHPTAGTTFNVRDRDYFQDLLQGKQVITRILKSRKSGNDIVVLLEPVRSPDGTLRGALGVAILDQQLVQFVQGTEVERSGFYALMDDSNRLIATTGNAELLLQAGNLLESTTVTDSEGNHYILSTHQVPDTEWHLVAAYPEAEIQAIYDRMMGSKLTAVAFGLTIAVLLALFFSERTLRPLRQIIQTFHRYARGDQSARVATPPPGEYAILAESFNALADELDEARQRQESHLRTLEESETRFRLLFDGAADAILLRNTEGYLIDVNQEACRSLGYTREELIGMPVWEIDLGWKKEGAEVQWNRLAREGRNLHPLLERVHRRKDGSTFPVEIRLTIIERAGEWFVMAAARDATLRKAAEVEMKSAKEFAEKMINASPGIVSIYDLPSRSLLFVNENVEKELGYTAQFMVNRGPGVIDSITHEDDLAVLRQTSTDSEQATDGEIRTNLFRLRHANGEWLWFEAHRVVFQRDAAGNATQVMGVTLNINDRVRAEQQVRWEKALLDQVMETSVAAILVIDAEGRFQFMNKAAEKTLRIRREEAQGKRASEYAWKYYELDGTPWNDADHPFAIVRETCKPVNGIEYKIEFGPDQYTLISANGAPLFDEGGAFAGAVFALTDITERIEAEKVREALIRNLEATNSELKQFTYTVSHDLKSPLITIKGFLGILSEDLKADDRAAIDEDITIIASAADGMKQLLDDLLELSRIGRSIKTRALIPLKEIVDEATTLLAGDIDAREAVVRCETGEQSVYGDAVQLRQLMQNLIDNAIKHNDRDLPEVAIRSETDGDFVVIEVADNGPGVATEYQERIFNLFDKLDPASEGSGIGLAIVKRIVDFHGGTISLVSEGPNTGCRFVIRLPATSPDPAADLIHPAGPHQGAP